MYQDVGISAKLNQKYLLIETRNFRKNIVLFKIIPKLYLHLTVKLFEIIILKISLSVLVICGPLHFFTAQRNTRVVLELPTFLMTFGRDMYNTESYVSVNSDK